MRSKNESVFVVDGLARVELTPQVGPDGKLRVHFGDSDLHQFGGRLVDRVSPDQDVEFVVGDFTHDDRAYCVNCFTVTAGGLDPWPRQDRGAHIVMHAADDDRAAPVVVRYIVVAVREDGQKVYVDEYPIAEVYRMGTGN